jgi:hypothetical protein
MNANTLFGHEAELRIYPVDGDRTTFIMPWRPFIESEGQIAVDVREVSRALGEYERERYMRARLQGVRIDGKVYAPEDVELIYEDQGTQG